MVTIPWRVVWFAVVCGLIGACLTIAGAPQNVFPQIELARVEVFADAGGLPAESVRTGVAEPLEAALSSLPGLRTTRTYANTGRLEIELDFDSKTNASDDRVAVTIVVNGLRARLPIAHVTVVVEGPEAEPVVTYAIVSQSSSQAELARRVRAATRTLFLATPGLGRVTLFAGPHMAYDVTLDATRLAHFRVTAREVATAIGDANATHVAGTITRKDERLSVVSGAPLENSADLAGVGVDVRNGRAVALTALGRIAYEPEPGDSQASFDATHAVLLNVYPTANGDAVALASEIARRVARLGPALPDDARVTIAWDQTRLIRASQRALRFEMLTGAAIALLVIAFFLRAASLTLVAAIVLPLALALTVAALVRTGLRLDLMTLGGLAIAIGLIVDEIIVVVETIARGDAVRRIARPLAASTAANIVVFLPLALLGGISGFFFRALAITLSLSLAISIVLSLVLAPSLARALRSRAATAYESKRAENAYAALVRAALRRPVLVCAAALGVTIVSAVLLARTPTDFLPTVDEGQFEVTYSLPPGTSLAAADRMATLFERTLLLDGAVDHVARLSGVDTNGYLATPPDAGTLRVTLKDGKRPSFDAIADRTRDRLESLDPNVAVEIHQLLEDQINDLSGAPEAVQITVYGPDQAKLANIAGSLADAIAPVHGLTDVFDGVTYEARSIAATPADLAIPASAAFAAELRDRYDGIAATEIASDGGPIPVNVRVSGGTPISSIARFAAPAVTSTVTEEDGARLVRVTAGIEGADLSTTIDRVRTRIAPILASLPAGYRVDLGGTIVAQQTAFAEFAAVFAIALVLVFGVLLATFDSFRLPLVVLAAIPTMPIGVALALLVTKTPLNVASFMGMLLLTGLVVRAGILLVDSAERRTREGATPADAMEAAARERLRPIVMTTCATIGAVAPLALGFGPGAEFERPLAIAVIGGIFTATALTLVLIPTLYIAVMSIRRIPTTLEAPET